MTRETKKNTARKPRDRPFPWRCATCLKDEVYPDTIRYSTDAKHDGRVYHIEVPELRIPKCRACGALVFTYTADDQVLDALRAHVRLLTPAQIKNGRLALGLKKKQLAERLGVAAATISRWERGGLIQSRAMDNYLRVYFAVPEVRAVLKGPEQDPSLGAKDAPGQAPADKRPPRPGSNRIWRALRDVEKASERKQAFSLN
jgi:putative zinc finger/helix-turn-helix YgiT family protein